MEHWWNGDRRAAAAQSRRALALNSLHADAHNHLAIEAMDRHRLDVAERHLRAALEGGARDLHREDDQLPRGWIENRPYLRALCNQALVLRRREHYREALAIHESMLALNPNDTKGSAISWARNTSVSAS